MIGVIEKREGDEVVCVLSARRATKEIIPINQLTTHGNSQEILAETAESGDDSG